MDPAQQPPGPQEPQEPQQPQEPQEQQEQQEQKQDHEQKPQPDAVPPPSAKSPEPKLTKNNILEALKDFDSAIPDPVVHHFLNHAGMHTSDPRVVKLIAIAAQKFIHDIISDSLQHCKLRGAQGKKTKEKKLTLAIEDLAAALGEYGIEVKRQQYFN